MEGMACDLISHKSVRTSGRVADGCERVLEACGDGVADDDGAEAAYGPQVMTSVFGGHPEYTGHPARRTLRGIACT
jgi:hypothetical protein